MSKRFLGKKDDFVMFLPEKIPLISYNSKFEVVVSDRLELFVSTTIDRVSMEFLIEGGVFPQIQLPVMKPLTKYELGLELLGKNILCEMLKNRLEQERETINPINIIIYRQGKEVPPFRLISNYQVQSWCFMETPLAPPEFIELANKPPQIDSL